MKILIALVIFILIPSYYWSQDSVVRFTHQYSLQNTLTECQNNQALQGKNKISLAFDIAFGITIKKRLLDFYPNISIGKQNNRVTLSYNGIDLPTHYILNYWYIKSSFNMGIKINARKKLSFVYSFLYCTNGDIRYSGKNTNNNEQLYLNASKSYLNYGIGIEYSTKINETSNTQFFYKIETYLKQNQFTTTPNNNYAYISKTYNIFYQSHIISIGLRFEGFKRMNKSDND